MAGRPMSPDAKRKVLMTRVDENEYDKYIKLAEERGTNVAELIRRLLHEEATGRSRVGYCTLLQRDFVDAIKRIPEDNLDDLAAYALLWRMSIAQMLIEFDRALDADELIMVDGKLTWNDKEKTDEDMRNGD